MAAETVIESSQRYVEAIKRAERARRAYRAAEDELIRAETVEANALRAVTRFWMSEE